MKTYIIALIFVVLAHSAYAATATSTLSWTAPDAREDDTPLRLEEIGEYRIFYAVDAEPTTNDTYVSATGAETGQVVTLELTPRVEPYVVSFAVMVVDKAGRQSALSEVVSKKFEVESTANPSPPTNIQFTFACSEGAGCTITEVTAVQ
tara:strand:- start:6911 stop:7357 length:447 start_codon:yes stop_codon:yes gene_type:complete